MRLAIAAAALLAFAGAAAAQTIRKVPQDYDTIQEAENDCDDGDTIRIAPGHYFEWVTLDVPNVTIAGSGVVWDGNIDGADSTILSIYSSGVRVQGVTFRNGGTQVYSEGGDLLVSRCTFIDSNGATVDIDSGTGNTVQACRVLGSGHHAIQSTAPDTRVSMCRIRSVNSAGISLSAGGPSAEGNTVNVTESYGVYVSGTGAAATKNKVFNTELYGIYASGAGPSVVGNTVQMVDEEVAIYVTGGTDALVEKNRVTDAEGGIYVGGDGATVTSNRISGIHGNEAGIEVSADDMTVVGNSAKFGSGDSFGYWLYNNSVTGGGLIERNSASEMSDSGFYLLGIYNCAVNGLTATNCGAEDEAGIDITGNDNSFTKLVVGNVDNIGIWVESGTGNDFTACSVKGCTGNGYLVGGSGNTFTNCTAANCGEGFDNRGTNTELTGGKYRGDRFDITNTGGTFSGGLGSVDFVTGGTTQASEVD